MSLWHGLLSQVGQQALQRVNCFFSFRELSHGLITGRSRQGRLHFGLLCRRRTAAISTIGDNATRSPVNCDQHAGPFSV